MPTVLKQGFMWPFWTIVSRLVQLSHLLHCKLSRDILTMGSASIVLPCSAIDHSLTHVYLHEHHWDAHFPCTNGCMFSAVHLWTNRPTIYFLSPSSVEREVASTNLPELLMLGTNTHLWGVYILSWCFRPKYKKLSSLNLVEESWLTISPNEIHNNRQIFLRICDICNIRFLDP